MSQSFQQQLELHKAWVKDPENSQPYDNISPHSNWTLDDYKELHYYIKTGYLCAGDEYNDSYIINPYWEDSDDE